MASAAAATATATSTANGYGGSCDRKIPRRLKRKNYAIFSEGISRIFSQWTALQLAVENRWGGPHSRTREENFITKVFQFFIQPKGPILVCDLEYLLTIQMSDSFDIELELGDKTFQQVADDLMLLHEDLLYDDMTSIERLRNVMPSESVSKSKKVKNKDGESSTSEASDMAVDEQESGLEANLEAMRVDDQKQQETVGAEDGWTVVSSSRRNKGKRH